MYSLVYCSEDEVRVILEIYLKYDKKIVDVDVSKVRKIIFLLGYCKMFWVENCVVIGIFVGFLEFLEVLVFVMIELFVIYIVK